MKIPYAKVDCSGNEFGYVQEVLESGWLTSASKAKELENKFASMVGINCAFAVNSCTSALHLALEAVGVGQGNQVLLPSMTFTATAEVVRYLGADPIFLDVEYGTSLLSVEIVEQGLALYPDVVAVIAVDFAGQPAPLLMELCHRHGVKLVVDAAHAFPARLGGKMVGTLADVTCFSFYANKTITTGEGGMLTTNDEAIAERVRMMRLHGIDRDVWNNFTSEKSSWEYDVKAPGFKYNMPDVNAAIGLAQLERAEEMRSARQKIAELYLNELSGVAGVDLPVSHVPLEDHALHLFPIVLNEEAIIERNQIIENLFVDGIGTSVHYKPLHRMSYYRDQYNLKPESYPNTEKIWRGNFSLPIYSLLSEEEALYVVEKLKHHLGIMEIPLSKPDITDLERKAVIKTLNSSRLSIGPKIIEFEEKIAAYVGAQHGVAVSSGTSALHLCIKALGIEPGDEVITTPFSFVASANCILYENAVPVFVDIDPITLNLDVTQIESKITSKTKAILPVHVFGFPCEMKKILSLGKKYDLAILEDASEAIGSSYEGRKVGAIGDCGVFGFYPNKQITMGEGGVIVTNDDKIASLCRSLRNQGRDDFDGMSDYPRMGYNYRISEIQCAIGVAQLQRIDELLRKRQKVADCYNRYLKDFDAIQLPPSNDEGTLSFENTNSSFEFPYRSWFVYVIVLHDRFDTGQRNSIIKNLNNHGISCNYYFPPIHLQPYFVDIFNYQPGDFLFTENISERTIALPFFGEMKESEVAYVVSKLKKELLKHE